MRPANALAVTDIVAYCGSAARSVGAYGSDAERQVIALLWPFVRLALRNPRLVPLLLAAGWRFRRRDWYRTPPFLPVPTQAYIRWRMYTAYGSETSTSSAADLERYLRWSAWMNRRGRTSKERTES